MIDQNADYNGKYSKEGWPLGKYWHRVGTIHKSYADDITKGIRHHADVAEADVQISTVGDSDYVDLFVHARISMERYAILHAFVDGYKFALQ